MVEIPRDIFIIFAQTLHINAALQISALCRNIRAVMLPFIARRLRCIHPSDFNAHLCEFLQIIQTAHFYRERRIKVYIDRAKFESEEIGRKIMDLGAPFIFRWRRCPKSSHYDFGPLSLRCSVVQICNLCGQYSGGTSRVLVNGKLACWDCVICEVCNVAASSNDCDECSKDVCSSCFVGKFCVECAKKQKWYYRAVKFISDETLDIVFIIVIAMLMGLAFSYIIIHELVERGHIQMTNSHIQAIIIGNNSYEL